MLFSEVIGQEELKQKLTHAAHEGRVSHAQLFLGKEGSGNMALALAYAQYAMCENPSQADACGACSACVKMHKLAHPDLHFAFPVNSSKAGGKNPVSDMFLEPWRQALLQNPYITEQVWYEAINLDNKQGNISTHEADAIMRKLSLKAFEGKFKILLMWLPERMNATAANKLLKLIEEPPAQTLFLFVAQNSGQMLKTILSRTQLVSVPPVRGDALAAMLTREFALPQGEASTLAHLANGSVAEARRIAGQRDEKRDYFEQFVTLMRLSYASKAENIILLVQQAEKIAMQGREWQKNFLLYSQRMVRENFALNRHAREVVYLAGEEADFSEKFSMFINPDNIFRLYEELNLALQHLGQNGNAKIIFTDLALKLVKLIVPLKDAK
ncbi:MAG: DNA polymerase III subunit delta [Prevotellaceae bacterium]|jgi:DNA polymerase-3 subunit delta'|nr:DNA polymerase III subunit delta [Prevotellaceae bacterium]